MDTRLTLFLNRLSSFCLYAAVFLIPLFFLPFIQDKFELSKHFLFYFLVLVSLLAFIGRSVLRKNFEFRRTPLDIPLAVLWLLFLASGIFSQDRILSFFGDFSFMGISFVSFTLLIVFYFLAIQHVHQISQILKMVKTLLLSGGLAAVYFILYALGAFTKLPGVFGWDLDFGQWLPGHNLIHSSNALFGVFLVLIFLVSLGLFALKKKNWGLDIFSLLIWLVSGAALVMIGFKVVWIILAAALFLLLVFFLTYLEDARSFWFSLSFIVLILSILFIIFSAPRFLTAELPFEISLSQKASWNLSWASLSSGAKELLFGGGPGTFAYSFSQFRPSAMNLNFAWNVRFNHPYSSILNWITTHGLLASLAFSAVILMVLGSAMAVLFRHIADLKRKKRILGETREDFKNSPLVFWILMGGWLVLLISLFFVNFGLVHWMVFWLFTALVVAGGASLSKNLLPVANVSLKTTPQYTLVTSFSFILIFTLIFILGVYLGRFFSAEVIYARSLSKPLEEKISDLQTAVKYNPGRAVFYLNLADSYLEKAGQLAQSGAPAGQVAQIVSLAVNYAKTATDRAPANVAAWEVLSAIYANARAIAPEANSWVISSLEKAIKLEPTNSVLHISLGNAKLFERRYSEAKEDFEKAVSLKPDMLEGYLRLAALAEIQGDKKGAVEALEKGLPYGRQTPAYLFQLGRNYFNRGESGDLSLAEAAFGQAVQLIPNYSDAIYSLALVYERTGRRERALEFYKKVLELNPANADLKKKINSLSGGEEKKE